MRRACRGRGRGRRVVDSRIIGIRICCAWSLAAHQRVDYEVGSSQPSLNAGLTSRFYGTVAASGSSYTCLHGSASQDSSGHGRNRGEGKVLRWSSVQLRPIEWRKETAQVKQCPTQWDFLPRYVRSMSPRRLSPAGLRCTSHI